MIEVLTLFLADTIILVPFVGAIACVYQWRVYASDTARPRSWVLFWLAVGSTIACGASIVLAILASLRFAGISLQGLGALLIGFMVLILELIPIAFSLQVYRRRRI